MGNSDIDLGNRPAIQKEIGRDAREMDIDPSQEPQPPECPGPEFFIPPREVIVCALDTLEDAGEDGIRAVCGDFPPNDVARVLNRYKNDVLPWVKVVKEIADAVS